MFPLRRRLFSYDAMRRLPPVTANVFSNILNMNKMDVVAARVKRVLVFRMMNDRDAKVAGKMGLTFIA